MVNLQGNLWDKIGLQWFAETPVEGPPGEPEKEPSPIPLPGEGGEGEGQPVPFYEWQPPEGEKQSYKSPEDLAEAMKKSFFMQSDYTRKTTELKSNSERIRQREQELETLAKQLNETGNEYKKFKEFMNARPDTFAKFKSMVESPPSPEESFNRSRSYTNDQIEEIKKTMEELKTWKQDQEFDRQKTTIYDEMRSQYSDFNSEEVEGLLTKLGQNDPKGLIETAYFALKGRLDPVEMERRVAEAAEKKRRENAGITPGSGRPAPKQEFGSVEEGREAALREAR